MRTRVGWTRRCGRRTWAASRALVSSPVSSTPAEEVSEAAGEDTAAPVSPPPAPPPIPFITRILSRCLQTWEQGCKYVSVGLKRQNVPTFLKFIFPFSVLRGRQCWLNRHTLVYVSQKTKLFRPHSLNASSRPWPPAGT